MSNDKRIELLQVKHSEEIDEIIGKPPPGITRWGIISVASFVGILLIISFLVRYAEVVRAEVKINGTSSLKPVVTRSGGKLVQLLVREDQQVKEGQLLGYMESIADHNEVIRLSNELSHVLSIIKKGDWKVLLTYDPSYPGRLGELQAPYQTFISQLVQLKSYLNEGVLVRKLELMNMEVNRLQQQQQNLKAQQKIYEEDLVLAREEFMTQEQLYNDKVVAKMDHNHNQSKLLTKELPLKTVESSILNSDIAVLQKRQEILRLDQDFIDTKTIFVQSLNTLISNVDNWKQEYLLTAPITGHIVFSKLRQENEQLGAGEEILYVAPPSSGYKGEMYVSQDNFGKVEAGQLVLLSVNSYPSQEYGKLRGKISYISSVPDKDMRYLIIVDLDNALVTDNKRTLNFRNGLTANAEIITQKQRLIMKLVYTITNVLNNTSKE